MEPKVQIEVSKVNEELIAGPRANRGDTVVWIFTGKLIEKDLVVRRKDDPDSIFMFHKPEGSDRVGGIPFPIDRDNDSFEYEIVEKGQEQPLPWASGRNGGCLKPMWPRS